MPAFSAADRQLLRQLAAQVAEIAHLPIMAERRAMWMQHNRLRRVRPMILVFPEGAWRELLPEAALACQDERARKVEWELRRRLYHHAHLFDDSVIEDLWVMPKRITVSGWGIEPQRIPSQDPTGAWAFDPVIHEPSDLDQLRFPDVSYDAEGSARDLEEMQSLFGDILDVRAKGVAHISFHLAQVYTSLRGLEQVMWDMYDRPEMLHCAMAFLEEGCKRIIEQYQALNLLSLNNDGTYHSSGGVGFTTELPQSDADPAHVRPCDMWASAESQELAQVSPRMHAEFFLPYEQRLLAPFGLNGYGCCEDLTAKLDDVLAIPNIRRISISPFAHVERCAERLGREAIFSWKPHPAHLVGSFDHALVRDYLKRTIKATRGCIIEVILKDTHTCEHHPERFTQWTEIARELAADC